MLRAIGQRHLVVLNDLKTNGNYLSVTSMIKSMSGRYKIPESSLRNCVKQLKDLSLIRYDTLNCRVPVQITDDGNLILKIISQGV